MRQTLPESNYGDCPSCPAKDVQLVPGRWPKHIRVCLGCRMHEIGEDNEARKTR